MTKIKITLLFLFLPVLLLQGQNLKKLIVFATDNFDSRASITVEALKQDPLIATDALKNALVMQGFKVISERVAKEKIELSNKGQFSDTTFNQDISVSKVTYLKSVYIITLNYQWRPDMGCGGLVISNLSGQIVDIANDGQIVATFSFKQGSFEGKCTSEVMNALAKKLKELSKNT